jgi:cell division protein ZapA (FtsZ GTPase activity inhibitor)
METETPREQLKTPSPHSATIRLLGETITIKTTDSDTDFVAEVIDLVSTRLDLAESRMKNARHAHQIVLLALLDLAEEYVRAKRRTADYKSEIEFRAKKLLKSFDPEAAASSLTIDLTETPIENSGGMPSA